MCARDNISVHCAASAYTGGRWVAAAGVARHRDLARPHALAVPGAALGAAPARRARAQAGLRLNRWHRQRAQQQQAALDSGHSWNPSPRSSTASSRHPAGAPRLAWNATARPPPGARCVRTCPRRRTKKSTDRQGLSSAALRTQAGAGDIGILIVFQQCIVTVNTQHHGEAMTGTQTEQT